MTLEYRLSSDAERYLLLSSGRTASICSYRASFGVTDLFLGVSPTQGAASRHATGFVGVQQEAMARTEEIQSSDATAFSHLCQLIYEAEVQFGPEERILRLQGRDGPLTQSLTRDDIWFRGEYDFTVGANYGIYSSMMRQQQAQVLQQISQTSPFVNQDPGRRWEVENFVFHSYGFPEPSIFIGPKDAVSAGSPTKPDEENGEMDQSIYGEGLPAPVHPSDNDEEHLRVHRDHISSPAFAALGSPNLSGHFAHIQATQAQIKSKMMMSQMSAQNAMMGNQPELNLKLNLSPMHGMSPLLKELNQLELWEMLLNELGIQLELNLHNKSI